MDVELLNSLLVNSSIVLSISLLYIIIFLSRLKKPRFFNIIFGVVLGLAGVFLMSNAVVTSPGIVFDTRSILVSVGGLFFGYVPTIIAVIIICIYRILLGGSGAITGILVTIMAAGVGLLWHQFRLKKILLKKRNNWPEFYLFGLTTHVVMIASLLTLPNGRIGATLQVVALPILVVFPFVSMVLSTILIAAIRNKQTEEDLKSSELRFRTILEQAPIGIAISKDRKPVYFNEKFEKILGRSKEELLCVGWESYTHPDDLEEDMRKLKALWTGSIKDYSMIKRYIKPDGSTVWVDMTVVPLHISEQESQNHLCMVKDITQMKKAETERTQKEEQILYLYHHDVLTGLYNRAFFDEEIRRLDTSDHLPLSVIIGDINGLKFTNNAFGHTKGDFLITKMAGILQMSCRESDIIARTGGDEFSILLPNTDSSTVYSIVELIKNACTENAIQSENAFLHASISLGYATKTRADEPFEQVQTSAEELMYRHKLLEHKSLHSAIISSIKTTLFEKSNDTEEHAERMAALSKKLGKAVGFSEDNLVSLELVSALHDIGKISIDQRILDKPGKLNEKEWAEIRKHPDVGYRIALTVPELSHIAEYILCHHERWDGKGYPQGLAAEDIPIVSRILTLVDSYDAMTHDRSYRKAMSNEEAIIEIQKNMGTQFDPELAKIFVEQVLPNEGQR